MTWLTPADCAAARPHDERAVISSSQAVLAATMR